MNTKITDIVFREIIPLGIKKTGLNMVLYYFHEWREKKRAERMAKQGGKK